jgi:glycosyltransferase involved in cell wall biosynthesis
MNPFTVYFAIPGNLATLTGGYGYDRRLLAGLRQLNVTVVHQPLDGGFPAPTAAALEETGHWLQSLQDGSTVLVDGLAYGVMDTLVAAHADRLHFIALCHHPLALETGLSAARQQQLHASEQRALALAQAVIVTSERTRKTLIEQFAVPPAKITAVVPGTDRRGFAECNNAIPLLLTVATLTRRKAHNVLIAALAQLQQLPWRARFIGGDEFDPAWAAGLRHQVRQCGLQQRIEFSGAREVLHDDYLAADVFTLPSLYEGYGMVFAEALGYGLPIIAASVGAAPDIVPSSAGLLVEPGSVDALKAALEQVLTDEALRRRLQHGARSAAQALTDWNHTARTVKAVLERVMKT